MSSGEQEQHLLGIDFGNGTNYERFPKPVISPLLDAVNTIIACLAVLGNGMVITVMLLRRRVFSSFTNRLILHQSIIDAIAVIVFFLHHVVIKSPHVSVSMKENINDHLVCRFVYSDFALWCVNVTSTYNHVVISLERFMATCYPVKHRNTLTKTKFKIVVPAVWIVGIIDNVPLLFVNEPHLGCCQMGSLQSGWLYVLYTFPITVEYLVPVTVMIFTYTRILIMLTKKLADPGNAALNVINKAKKDLIRTTLITGITFLLCWTPIQIYYFQNLMVHDEINKELLYKIFVSLVACSMLVHPIIYWMKYPHFRSQLKDLVLTRFQRNRVHIQDHAVMLRPA